METISNLPVLEKFIADIGDAANLLQRQLADVLGPAPKGIYISTNVDPIMVDGGNYFTISKENDKIIKSKISDITSCEKAIYSCINGIDRIIIPKTYMLNKQKYLSAEPILPYHGVKIILALITDAIQNQVRWMRNSNYFEREILKLVKLDSSKEVEKDNFEKVDYSQSIDEILLLSREYCADILKDVNSFIGVYDWHIYFVSNLNMKLMIERSIDHRAYQWMQSKQIK